MIRRRTDGAGGFFGMLRMSKRTTRVVIAVLLVVISVSLRAPAVPIITGRHALSIIKRCFGPGSALWVPTIEASALVSEGGAASRPRRSAGKAPRAGGHRRPTAAPPGKGRAPAASQGRAKAAGRPITRAPAAGLPGPARGRVDTARMFRYSIVTEPLETGSAKWAALRCSARDP